MSMTRRPANPLRHPVGAAIIKRQIIDSVRSLQVDAQLHALIGESDAHLIDRAGRLAYIAAEASQACGLPDDAPDRRIVEGMARALAELANGEGDRDLHRLAIQSGLAACERLLAQCSPWDIGTAALKVDELIHSPKGLTLFDIAPPRNHA